MTKIIISNNAENLGKALEVSERTATVEAEYGETVVRGSLETLAHHTKGWQNEPCPCLAENRKKQEWPIEIIGVSHFDLDTLGGVMALMGKKPNNPIFWEKAAFIDINGIHKANFSDNPELERLFNAFWAWSENNRLFAPRDGSVLDCTEFFETAVEILNRIFVLDTELLEAGKEWASEKERLNEDSYVRINDNVILRRSENFVNHLYKTPTGSAFNCTALAVVAFNEKFKSVTISLSDPVKGISCKEVAQELWGGKAGGHPGIAGSPRGQEMNFEDAEKACVEMAYLLQGK